MNNRITTLCAAVALGLLCGLPASAATPQQEKMKTCNADFKATGKPGSEHKAFMKTCLSAKAAPAEAAASASPQKAQQNKMKTCSADFKATGKPGGERKAFMKECLAK
jgi:hypothetical protein